MDTGWAWEGFQITHKHRRRGQDKTERDNDTDWKALAWRKKVQSGVKNNIYIYIYIYIHRPPKVFGQICAAGVFG